MAYFDAIMKKMTEKETEYVALVEREVTSQSQPVYEPLVHQPKADLVPLSNKAEALFVKILFSGVVGGGATAILRLFDVDDFLAEISDGTFPFKYVGFALAFLWFIAVKEPSSNEED